MDELRFEAWQDQHVDQVAVVPFRTVNEAGSYEFCLITTSSGRWTFPKGSVRSRKKLRSMAELEAWEEAGVKGKLDEQPFGYCELAKSGAVLRAATFLMEVEKSAKKWPEQDSRRRIWVGPVAASALLTTKAQLEALQNACWEIERRRASHGLPDVSVTEAGEPSAQTQQRN